MGDVFVELDFNVGVVFGAGHDDDAGVGGDFDLDLFEHLLDGSDDAGFVADASVEEGEAFDFVEVDVGLDLDGLGLFGGFLKGLVGDLFEACFLEEAGDALEEVVELADGFDGVGEDGVGVGVEGVVEVGEASGFFAGEVAEEFFGEVGELAKLDLLVFVEEEVLGEVIDESGNFYRNVSVHIFEVYFLTIRLTMAIRLFFVRRARISFVEEISKVFFDVGALFAGRRSKC